MVYKLISEWKSEDVHEIVVCKYNYSHEEMVKYWYHPKHHELRKQTSIFGGRLYNEKYDTRSGAKKWWNYNSMVVKN